MTPEEINQRISTWAGLDSHVCDEWSFHCDDCERGSIQTPDYIGSNAAMDLLWVLVERGYKVDVQSDGPQWSMVLQHPDMNRSICSLRDTIPAAICTAIIELIEREGR